MTTVNPLSPPLPQQQASRLNWGNVAGSRLALTLSQLANHESVILVITNDSQEAAQLKREIKHFSQGDISCFQFPDWETLPYDQFSPHQDIVSDRLKTLYELPHMTRGIVLAPVTTLLHRIVPKSFVMAHSFSFKVGQTLHLSQAKQLWIEAGYLNVSQVMRHGEFAVRGSIIDLFPMGHDTPIRLDLFDDEIDSIRLFDIETQRSHDKIDELVCLPAREYPLGEDARTQFRSAWRKYFTGTPTSSPIYEAISKGHSIGGIEYYLPLFFEQTQTLFDYLPDNSIVIRSHTIEKNIEQFETEINHRYEQYRHDISRPLITPKDLYLQANELFQFMKRFRQVITNSKAHDNPKGQNINLDYAPIEPIALAQQHEPLKPLASFLQQENCNILICAESPGRMQALQTLLEKINIKASLVTHWQEFLEKPTAVGLTITPLTNSFKLPQEKLVLLAEGDIYGQQVMQRRRRQATQPDIDYHIRHFSELQIGNPVVHIDHGIGRYLGLVNLQVNDYQGEYLALEYADSAKLYVPVSQLDLISQYGGTHTDTVPVNRLGSNHWDKAKQKAKKRIKDVAAELLEIHAKRAMRHGHAFTTSEADYIAFANGFGFETTPDQQKAIDQVLMDMQSDQPMDRLVCGDVGFGKTEVALRAAFLAAVNNKQTALLVPTTLLAQQHYETFCDRFADWPVKIEVLSRFRTKKEQAQTLDNLQNGRTDIVIGTHKLLMQDMQFKQLGLLIIDEEHRFGVKQKERIKKLRSEVDILTLTATPIPRTLNLSLTSVRDLSIITTPPLKRLSIKTFVREYNETLIDEAINRELMRGGQVYFLHNDVKTIEQKAEKIQALCPNARIIVAHGQMPERALERVMADFYHQRFNVLVCTTIIETGIDIPSANTIIIERADKFGLAQLHQLRGRVGRSHHQAYAYCLTPPKKVMTSDAIKRLDALASLEDLGSGFTLATHDLEIRGAGEILGEEQSGNMNEIGFDLYMSLLEKTVHAFKQGQSKEIDIDLQPTLEIDLQLPAFIPDDYLPDVHSRLLLYKRISACKTDQALQDMQVEMIDRFGLLPPETKNLFQLTSLKRRAANLGINNIQAGPKSGKIEFVDKPNIDPDKIIALLRMHPNNYKLLGSQAFRFTFDMQTVEQRFQVVDNLLYQLS